ncbi:MAG TPA: HWE histidine kinase domain-containing protein [Xanthobacteraceae bacterium]|nr:HWE histidine kinase domain-containing protein [Xanthobacteraceae bacterium]
MRSHDWAATPLGPPETWPQSLRTTVRLMLNTKHPMFIWWGPELIQFYNDAYRQTMGPERHPSALGQRGRECWDEIWDIIGPQIEMVLAGEGATWHEDHLVPVTRHGRREDVWWTYSFSPIDDETRPGGVGGVMVICNDVTERHRMVETLRANEAHLKLLANELNHRVKNTLATVQAIASQTLQDEALMGEARSALTARLMALAKAHDILTEEGWAGADLADIVTSTLDTFGANGLDGFQIQGPSVQLSARSTVLFAMTLNELCTNAMKYGALSAPGGKIRIAWQVQASDGVEAGLQMQWSESGGPPVKPPTRKGFGSRLIETALAAEFGGGVALDYAPSGVICSIRVPLAAIEPQALRPD